MEKSISQRDITEYKTLRNPDDMEIQGKVGDVNNIQISRKLDDNFVQTEQKIEEQRKILETELEILKQQEVIIQKREINLKEEKRILQERENNFLRRENVLNMRENDIEDWENMLRGRIKILNWREESLNDREGIISKREKLIFKYFQKTSAIECSQKNREHILNEKQQLLERREKLLLEKICCMENNKHICVREEFLQKDKIHLKCEEESSIHEKEAINDQAILDTVACEEIGTDTLAENSKFFDQMFKLRGKVSRDLKDTNHEFESNCWSSTNNVSEEDNRRQHDKTFLNISCLPGWNSIWSYDKSVNNGKTTTTNINSDAMFIPPGLPDVFNNNSLKAYKEHTASYSPVKGMSLTNEKEEHNNNLINNDQHILKEMHETQSSKSKCGSDSENISLYAPSSSSFDKSRDDKIKSKVSCSKQKEKEPCQELRDLLRQIKSPEQDTCKKDMNNTKGVEISVSEEKSKLALSEDSDVEFQVVPITKKEQKDTLPITKSMALESQFKITSRNNVDNSLQPYYQDVSLSNRSYPSGMVYQMFPSPHMMAYPTNTFPPYLPTAPFQMHTVHNSNAPFLSNVNFYPRVPSQFPAPYYPSVFPPYFPPENSHINVSSFFRTNLDKEVITSIPAVKEKGGCILTPVSTESEITPANKSGSTTFKEIGEESKTRKVTQTPKGLSSNDKSAADAHTEKTRASEELKSIRPLAEDDKSVCQTITPQKKQNEKDGKQLMPESLLDAGEEVSTYKTKSAKNCTTNAKSGNARPRDVKRILRKRHILQEALFHAINEGTFYDAVVLIDYLDVPFDCRDKNGFTPFLLAVKKSDFELVQWLFDKGANPRVNNYDGQSALHIAVAANNEEVLKFLLESGNNPDVTNNNGSTPMEMADELGHVNMVKIINEFINKE